MFENLKNIFKRNKKKEMLKSSSKDTAKERLHLVLMQDRANVSADFLDLMRREIIEVIKKYIDIDEEAMDVRLATETNEDGTQGAPALYANIPIINIKDETRKLSNMNKEEKVSVEPPKKEDENEKENKTKEVQDEIKEEKPEEIKDKEIDKKIDEEQEEKSKENKESIIDKKTNSKKENKLDDKEKVKQNNAEQEKVTKEVKKEKKDEE